MKKLAKDKFDKMIVFLGWKNVERTNRVFRMLQKTRYKRRTAHTLEKALDLELYVRMLNHPLYQQKIEALPAILKELLPLKKAA
jgi:hypothetical protein